MSLFLGCWAVLWLVTQSCLTLCMDCSPRGSSVHGDSPGKNTGVACHALLQGIIPNPGVSCIEGGFFYHLSHQGSPRILQWVAYPFSRETSQPSSWTGVSCPAGFFTSWTTWKALVFRICTPFRGKRAHVWKLFLNASWKKYMHRTSLVAQLIKNPPAMRETLVQFLGQGNLLEKG